MIKKTLGDTIKRARLGLQMTQRELAERVGVKSSHIAYIETGLRRPSIPLLKSIADTLGLESREVLFLAHPEAKLLIGDDNGRSRSKNDSWKRFSSNTALLRRHHVTRAELNVLKQASLLEEISHPGHFVFILNAIRQAAVKE
jgi:transcriptional regulator with XRE-family HTH domain